MPDLSRWLNAPEPAPLEPVGHDLEPAPVPAAAPLADAGGVSYRSDGPESEPAEMLRNAASFRPSSIAGEHLAGILERTPRPDWPAEHAQAVERLALAWPDEHRRDWVRRKHAERAILGAEPVADLSRAELARNTLALLLAIPAIATGGMVLWTDYADQAELALEAARAALRKPRAGESAGTPRAA